jgi:hypothetical protein
LEAQLRLFRVTRNHTNPEEETGMSLRQDSTTTDLRYGWQGNKAAMEQTMKSTRENLHMRHSSNEPNKASKQERKQASKQTIEQANTHGKRASEQA